MLTPVLNRKSIIQFFPWLAFLTLIAILPVAFLYEKGGRVLFYYCAYFSLVGMAVEFWRKNKVQLTDRKALAMLMLGIVYVGWSLYAQYLPHTQDDQYYTAGKRCVLAFIILSYILHLYRTNFFDKTLIVKLSILSLALAFITSSTFAIYQSITSTERVVLGINRATLTAYAYSAVTLALITLILKSTDSKLKKFCFLFVSIVSLYVIMLTQTRSAMVIHTLFLAYMMFRLFSANRSVKFLGCVALLMFVAAGLSYKVIEGRLESTVNEYHDYEQGNDKTSLGSRFTMWKTGVMAFERAPFGQSQYERNKFITAYLDAHNQSDSWALIYINVHLHNEFIQFASLFGVVGIVVLLYFFYTFIIAEFRRYRSLTPLAVAGLAILLYGMTDVVMISVEFISIFSVLVVLLSLVEEQ
ncbi:O-antigen ligase family protein [Pantoea sp. Acro-805]|uniref:O-antigen ligase family protein n=1 Tax=Candidatus Pantoea formicae TaxID=2608355 RepID=A0ABX0QWG1_9GAMM|nr:O-antigen ligase family protein [Pantoea formicae]MDF7647328.1 O-antigen ligase family protein [Erwiniaceae bacterium L1_54_3]NIF01368.1 O-antigen ligase family protein [Pantoea formicae]